MKRMSFSLLCLALIFCFTSCGKTTDQKKPEQSSESVQSVGDQIQNSVSAVFTRAYGYTDGLMFVEIDDDTSQTHCINKKGEIIFTLQGYYTDITGFHNGIAAIYNDSGVVLCDTKGKITTAEDLGASSILIDEIGEYDGNSHTWDMFIDGYIPLRRTKTDFSGSVDELSIVDPKFNTIVDFSKEFYELFDDKHSFNQYYGGYLYGFSDSYLDLNTGTVYNGLSDMYDKIKPKYESDMWKNYHNYNGNYYYDIRYSTDEDRKIVIDLMQYSDTLYSAAEFHNGLAGIHFKVEDSNVGYRNYFTILKEDGTFCFDPFEIEGNALEFCQSGEKFLVIGGKVNDPEYAVYYTFDQNGKISESDQVSGKYWTGTFSDDTFLTYFLVDKGAYKGGAWTAYSIDLMPLF